VEAKYEAVTPQPIVDASAHLTAEEKMNYLVY